MAFGGELLDGSVRAARSGRRIARVERVKQACDFAARASRGFIKMSVACHAVGG